jgi:putative acetyltransferase
MKVKEPEVSDHDQIRQLYLSAFDKEERELVSGLAFELLIKESTPRTLHLIAEAEEDVAGHVASSPVWVQNSNEFLGYILAPLAVSPEHQKKGIGSTLVRKGLQRLVAEESPVVLVYGDPEYYSRFGFSSVLAEKYIPPFPLTYPLGWQALALSGKLPSRNPEKILCVEPLNKPELW